MRRTRHSRNWLRRIGIVSIVALLLLGLGTLRSRVIWAADGWRAECSRGAATIFWKLPSAKGTFQSEPSAYGWSLDRALGPIRWLPSFALHTPIRFVTIPLWPIVFAAYLVVVRRRRERANKAPTRRKWRHFVALTAISTALVTLLSVAIASAWWSVVYENPREEGFGIQHGRINVTWGLRRPMGQYWIPPNWIPYRNRKPDLEWKLAAGLSSGGSMGIVIFPLWIPIALLIVPMRRTCLSVRAHHSPGCCRRCNYNLTGLPESRCPECGQPFESKGDSP